MIKPSKLLSLSHDLLKLISGHGRTFGPQGQYITEISSRTWLRSHVCRYTLSMSRQNGSPVDENHHHDGEVCIY